MKDKVREEFQNLWRAAGALITTSFIENDERSSVGTEELKLLIDKFESCTKYVVH